MYNVTFMDSVTNIADLMIGIGNSLGQPYLIGYLLMLAFFALFMYTSKDNDMIENITVASFITTIMAILLAAASMIPGFAIAFPFVLFTITLVFRFFS